MSNTYNSETITNTFINSFATTVNELMKANAVISKIESKAYLNKGDFNLWEVTKNLVTIAKRELKLLGFDGFEVPINDSTNKIALMRYCNNGLSYGVNIVDDKLVYYLCQSPTLSLEIISIISQHSTFEEVRRAFYLN